jgi:hypothetical protein
MNIRRKIPMKTKALQMKMQNNNLLVNLFTKAT